MAIPLAIIAAAAAAKMAGDYAGGQKAKGAINRGEAAYTSQAGQGISTLQQGKADASAAYDPYTSAGTRGIGGYESSIVGRQMATQPTASNFSPQGASAFIDPSAAYTSDQATKALEAAAIAKGGMGGGLAKALSNNANKMAMTNYNTAYNQMLDTGRSNFAQGQQLYTNKTDYDQSQIANYGNLANLGLGATNANQNLLGQYNMGINKDYMDMGAMYQSNANNKAGVGNAQASGMGNSLLSGISTMYGAGK